MPVTYTIDQQNSRIHTKCTGPVSFPEVMQHFDTLEQDPDFRDGLDVFLDLSEVTSIPLSRQVHAAAARTGGRNRKISWGSCAIVASSNIMYGMARIFEVFASDHFKAISVFRETVSAEVWLAQSQMGQK